MGKRRHLKTAMEIVEELRTNAEYQLRSAEREKRFARIRAEITELSEPILGRLRSIGVDATTIEEVVNRYAPLSPEIVAVVLDSLQSCSDLRIVESLVRILAAAAHPFDGQGLVRCFESTNDENLRWVILNTVASARPTSIEEWVKQIRTVAPYGETLTKLGFPPSG